LSGVGGGGGAGGGGGGGVGENKHISAKPVFSRVNIIL
jgi:hypothetical protein